MTTKDLLVRNFREYLASAEEAYEKDRRNVAGMLYYKCLTTLSDYLILKETAKVISNHVERFKELKRLSEEAYDLISPLFDTYRHTYFGSLNEEDVEKLKNAVQRLREVVGIE